MTRTIVVLAAYLLSSVGILIMLMMIGPALRSPRGSNWIVVLVWSSAWVVHLVMSVAWSNGRRLHRAWPLCGAVLGFGCFLVWPYSFMKLGTDFPGGATPLLQGTADMMLVQFVLVSPCVLLGFWLLGYHLRRRPLTGQASPIASSGA